MEDPRLLIDEVTRLAREGAPGELARLLAASTPDSLADLLEHLDPPLRDRVFEALPATLAGEVASRLDETVREDLLEDVAAEQLAEMVAELESDEALPLLEEADAAITEEVLRRLDPEDAEELRELLGYEEESAGRAMAFGAPAVSEEVTLGEAVALLRASAEELDEVQTLFVVDGAGRLRGYLPLDVLILRPAETPVLEVMRRDVVFAYTYEDQEQVAARAQRSHLPAIPIIDSRGMLRGQVALGRIREIAEEEASEDMYRMVGLSDEESVYTGFGPSLRRRLPWLLLNLCGAFLAAWVISFFETTIAALAALAALQSVVAGQGGNAGIQTLTLTIRGLAVGDLDWRNSRRTFFRELQLGLANGTAVGVVIGLVVYAWRGNPWLGLVAGAAMVLNLLAAAVAGFSIPLALRAARRDPAQASGVLVTTLADVCGFLFFLGLATLCLPLLR